MSASGESPGKRRTAPWIAGGVGVVLVLLIVVLATRVPTELKPVPSPLIGKPVPDLRGTTLDSGAFAIDDQRGKFVVVNFFATWCVPCVQEHPELVRFVRNHAAANDVVVVSVAFNDTEAAIRDFFLTRGGTWPVITRDMGTAVLDFGVSGVPETYVISPSRQVVAKFIGVTEAGLDEVIRDISQQGGFTPLEPPSAGSTPPATTVGTRAGTTR